VTRRTFTLVDHNGDEQTFKIGIDLQAGDVLANGGKASRSWVADNALYAVQSLAPEPELPRVQRGDVIEREDAERVHILELVVRTGMGEVAQWRRDWWWSVGYKWSDDEISWPVTVIDVPGEVVPS